jgi:hypothetical protein
MIRRAVAGLVVDIHKSHWPVKGAGNAAVWSLVRLNVTTPCVRSVTVQVNVAVTVEDE